MANDMDKIDNKSLTLELNKIYELRSLLEKATELQEEIEIIDKLSAKIEMLEKIVDELITGAQNSESNEVSSLQEEFKIAAKEYDDSCRKMQQLIESQAKTMASDSDLLSDEEIHNTRQEYLEKKLEENRKSILIKERMKQIEKRLSSLEDGTSVSDTKSFEDISSTIEGLQPSFSFDNIEFLWYLDDRFIRKQAPSIWTISGSQINKIQKYIKKFPEKIVNSDIESLYTPNEVPKDMTFAVLGEKDNESFEDLNSSAQLIVQRLIRNANVDSTSKNQYQPINIHASEEFQRELEDGKYEYDIVYSVYDVGDTVDDCLFKLSENLVLTDEIKRSADKLKSLMIEELSPEEAKILFDWHKQMRLRVNDCPIIHRYIFNDYKF